MQCPDKVQVERFIRGELQPGEVSRFEAHLDICEECLGCIEQSASGSFAQLAKPITSQDQDSAFVHLIAALARRSEAVANLELPTRESFGPYRVLGFLARGAMGLVYEGIHRETGRKAAIKVAAAGSPRLVPAMREEIAFLEREQHPGIVRIFEHGIVDGGPWYAMELLEGKTLEDFNHGLWRRVDAPPSMEGPSRRSSPPKEGLSAAGGQLDEVLSLYSRLCVPLGFVHRAGFVHCDLKPANVFIRGDGQPVLMDFGLLSRAGGAIGRERLEVGGRLRGTLPYLSPELIRGQIPDARADLYALGCMLYESVAGRPPFVAKTANGFLKAHLHAVAEPASQHVAGVPQTIDDLLATLLAKRAAERIGDAGVVAERCAQILQFRDSRPPPAPSRTSSMPSAPYLFRPRMVGRDDVMERIHALREDAQRGQGRILLVGGESGIGKTFLASEVAQRAVRAGFEVVAGECTPVAATEHGDQEIVGAALEPFRKLLQNAADQCRDSGAAGAVQLFGSERTIALLARYEPALVHLLGGAPVQPIAALPPVAERERVLQALSDLLKRMAAANPLLVVVDDLQWADDLSLAFLELLASSELVGQRLLLLALYRSEEVSKPITDLEAKPSVQSLRLGRLDASTLSALVGDLLSDRPPAEFVQALAEHSEGNPFFVAEYLRAGAAEGLLERTAAGWRLARSRTALGYEGLALPASLQALLERRLAALTPEGQRVTEAAAVLGREFPVAMLPAMVGMTGDEIHEAIAEMLKRQIAQRVSSDVLRFLHDKTREAAYGRIDSQRRSELHRAAANVIEAAYAGTPELPTHYAELAYHCRSGGDGGRAVDYFERAGEHALGNSANADAVRFFREAIETSDAHSISNSAQRRALWERRTGDALQGLGNLAASKEHLLRSVRLLGHPLPTTEGGIGRAIMGKLSVLVLHRTVPHRWIQAKPGHGRVLLETARAYDRLMQIYYYRGEYVPLFFANLATLTLAERTEPSSTLAVAYANAAATAGIMPLRRVARLYFRLAKATLARAYDPEAESYFQVLYSHYLTGLGDWAGATAAADRVIELAEQLGFGRRWEEGTGLRSGLAWGRNFEECLRWCERMFESALRRSDAQTICWGYLRPAEVHVARGDLDLAERSLVQAEQMASDIGLPEQIRALGLRSFILARRGRLPDALVVADQAAKLIDETKTIHLYCVEPYARIAEVRLAALASGASDQSRALQLQCRAACVSLAKAARIFPIALPRYCLLEGTRQWLLGHKKGAIAAWKRGHESSISLQIPYEGALLTLALASRDPSFGRAIPGVEQEAEEVLVHLGARNASRPGTPQPKE